MRGTRDMCLFCRHAFSLRSSPRAVKRFASQRHREPYVLPRLVIDLDAADNKYVRKVEELEDWQPARTHSPGYKASRQDRRRLIHEGRPLPLKLAQVTPPDLLTYALMGDPEPSGASSRTTRTLRGIFRYHKVEKTDSVNEKAAVLSSEFVHNPNDRLKKAGYKETGFIWQMSTCHERSGFPELVRLVTMLSSTQEGCKFLVERSRFLLNAIKQCRKVQKQADPRTNVSSDAVLLLLNNLRINMESKGVKLNSVLCGTGLYYAAKSWNLSSIRTYLELLPVTIGVYGLHHTAILASQIIISQLLDQPEKAASPQGSAALDLITGWDGKNYLVGHKRKALSFLSVMDVPTPSRIFRSYLVGLAELGLKDILMAEWQADAESDVGRVFWKRRPVLKARSYAFMFLLLGDRNQALSALQPFAPESNEGTLQGNLSQPSTESNEGTLQSDASQPSTDRFGLTSNEIADLSASEVQSLVTMLEDEESGVEAATCSANSAQQSSTQARAYAEEIASLPPSETHELMMILKKEQNKDNVAIKTHSGPNFFRMLLYDHYRYHNIHPSESLSEAINETLNTVPDDPVRFLNILEQFIIRDYRAPLWPDPKFMKEAHWIDEKGVQGLVIFSDDRDVPLYWRAASQAVV